MTVEFVDVFFVRWEFVITAFEPIKFLQKFKLPYLLLPLRALFTYRVFGHKQNRTEGGAMWKKVLQGKGGIF